MPSYKRINQTSNSNPNNNYRNFGNLQQPRVKSIQGIRRIT